MYAKSLSRGVGGGTLRSMFCALVACAVAMAESIPPELDAYIARPDPSFAWSKKEEGLTPLHLRMTSQTWRNVRWTHDIVVSFPKDEGTQKDSKELKRQGAAILYVTGSEPNKADLNEAERLAEIAKMPVALLFQIPNQPLFGMKEDDLIAHTFEKYLTEGGDEWPLLFPMVKSAVRAMDALRAAEPTKFERFVVTGASKRGWTAWLAGAIQDKRVIGIAPMVFDNLRFAEQLAHQFASWGKYSEMLGDYTERGLQQIVDTEPGKKLIAMVDPWTYRSRITIPKLLVTGSNDRYWATDAMSQYWDGLAGPKYCSIVPNAGHLLGDMKQALNAIGAFARSCAGEFEMPVMRYEVEYRRDGSRIRIGVDDPKTLMVGSDGKTRAVPEPGVGIKGIWTAKTKTGDFRDAKWELAHPLLGSWKVEPTEGEQVAAFGEFVITYKDLQFSLSAPVRVFKG